MLFIPWTYLSLEAKSVRSSKIRERARSLRLGTAKCLKESLPAGEAGVIGGSVGDKLKTLPSAIYWSELQRWGIRIYPGTEHQYQQALDSVYRSRKGSQASLAKAAEDGDDIGGLWERGAYTFHPELPPLRWTSRTVLTSI